ncbi:hypothetical protein [Aggregatimonas sangjinii]|nr:hypothetical protein [Aggregatimonas sangjinii]
MGLSETKFIKAYSLSGIGKYKGRLWTCTMKAVGRKVGSHDDLAGSIT